MLGMAKAANERQDIETELVVGKGEMGLGLRTVGMPVAWASGVGTAADAEGKAGDGVERGDGAGIVVGGPERVLTSGAVGRNGAQGLGVVRTRAGAGACHGSASSGSCYLH